MAGQFTTTAEEMRAFSGKITEVNSQIQGELSKLNALVESIAGGWQGAAATAYHQLQERWNEDATALNKVLDEIRQAIDATTSKYSATEEDQRSSLSGVQGA
ncbi:WXG100 family type VII secretion target [Kitasatospora sp. NBC_01250]|uniref:WXG100 family type VII secretion target n=1 Tax=unclassified Kitasatospora TaxID=2633591 RepID=UPI002E14BECF|nr:MULTISPECIES: WXG100 family type VII secretion target [unclassified Kitasatospora]WSJ69483.1 WXG100 family type VII secretion target [Kitasatospora sp. NBC_01302]